VDLMIKFLFRNPL